MSCGKTLSLSIEGVGALLTLGEENALQPGHLCAQNHPMQALHWKLIKHVVQIMRFGTIAELFQIVCLLNKALNLLHRPFVRLRILIVLL